MTPDVIFSIITATIAIVALFQAQRQIKISNKQHLFEKHMENYIIASGFIELYLRNRMEFEKDEADQPDIVWLFNSMTNNHYLSKMYNAIQNPLTEPFHVEFLIKIEEIKEVATKIKLLFSGDEAKTLSNFIFRYQELLFMLYQYKILISNMLKSREYGWTYKKAQEEFNEPKQQEKYYKVKNNLRDAYNKVENEHVIKKIENQIKLR